MTPRVTNDAESAPTEVSTRERSLPVKAPDSPSTFCAEKITKSLAPGVRELLETPLRSTRGGALDNVNVSSTGSKQIDNFEQAQRPRAESPIHLPGYSAIIFDMHREAPPLEVPYPQRAHGSAAVEI